MILLSYLIVTSLCQMPLALEYQIKNYSEFLGKLKLSDLILADHGYLIAEKLALRDAS